MDDLLLEYCSCKTGPSVVVNKLSYEITRVDSTGTMQLTKGKLEPTILVILNLCRSLVSLSVLC
jgi:hypothetical protein